MSGHPVLHRPLWLGVIGLLACLLTGGGTALADAIPPPPACPPGSRGVSSHAGERCEPAPCQSDADCKDLEGTTCRRWRVCTKVYMVPAGGRRSFNTPPHPENLAVAGCPVEKGCTGTEEPPPPTAGTANPEPPSCVDRDFCVPKALPPLPTARPDGKKARGDRGDDDGDETAPAGGCCKCHLGARQDGHGWLLVLGLVLLLLRRRRP